MRIYVATAINRNRVRRPSSQPVAQWSKAGTSSTMCSNATDTRKSLGISDGSWRKCLHPGSNANKSPWTSWPSKKRNTESVSLELGSLPLGGCVLRDYRGTGRQGLH